MLRANRIMSYVVLLCFLFNTAVSDLAFGLATPSVLTDIVGIQHKDMGRIKLALEEQLVSLVHPGLAVNIGTFQTILKKQNFKEKTIFQPADMQFFFHEIRLTNEGFCVMARLNDRYGLRTYYATFSLQKDGNGGFPIEVYTEKQYKDRAQSVTIKEVSIPQIRARGMDYYNFAHQDFISKDGTFFIIDKILYETQSGKATQLPFKGAVLSADFSPSEMLLAVDYSGDEYSSELIDVISQQPVVIEGLDKKVKMWGKFSESGKYISADLADGVTVVIIDLEKRKVVIKANLKNRYARAHYSKNDRYAIVSFDIDKEHSFTSRLFDLRTGKEIDLSRFEEKNRSISISPDEKYAYIKIDKTQNVIYEFATEAIHPLPRGLEWAIFIQVQDSMFVDMGSGVTEVFNFKTQNRTPAVSNVFEFSISPSGDSVFIRYDVNKIAADKPSSALYYPQTGKVVPLDTRGALLNASYSANGKYLLIHNSFRGIENKLYDVKTGQLMPVDLQEEDKPFFSVDGNTLIVFSSGSIRVCDLANLADSKTPQDPAARNTGLKISNTATAVFQEGVLEIRTKRGPGAGDKESVLVEITFIRPGRGVNLQTWILSKNTPYRIAESIVDYLKSINFDPADDDTYLNLPRHVSALSDNSLTDLSELRGPVELYEVLGLKPNATPEEIKSAYRRLAKQYHPDHNAGDKIAEEKFKEVDAAYKVLTNPKNRLTYDLFGYPDEGRRTKPGKSPDDLLKLIARYTRIGEEISASKLLDLYIVHWEELRFEKPSGNRKSALRTVERDLFESDNSLEKQGIVKRLDKKGEKGEFLFEVTKKGCGAAAQVKAPVQTQAPTTEKTPVSTTMQQAQDEITAAIAMAGEAGLQIPTHPNEHYNLLVTSEFFANGELEEHRAKYGDRFDLDRISGRSPAQFVDNILAKASGKETRTIALVPNDLLAEQLERLTKVGVRFVRVNASDLHKAKSDKDTNREKFQVDTYTMMLLLRRIDNSITADSSIYRLLSFYLKSHFTLSDKIAIDDYIIAIINNDVTKLIKGLLAYRPAQPYEAPNYNNVAASLISA